MSLTATVPAASTPASPESADPRKMREVRYEYTPILPELLQQAGVTLLVTTYQAGKLLTLGSNAGELTISFCHFDRAMGVAADRRRMALGTRRQIHFFKAAPELGPQIEPAGTHDGCWLPRGSFYTGNIHGHELAWGNEGLWVVNTSFSTLCTLHEEYSFVPRWRPKFITELQAQDRCHLNGLALENGAPRYVTAMAESNAPAGWRPTKATSGCVIDVPSQETVLRGLAMPHSPRLHGGRLWVLNSGCGQFGCVDLPTGKYEPVTAVPGYTRGLAFAGRFAFVGLSRIRETAIFGGVPIAEHREQLKCGIAVIDLTLGRTVAVFQFHSGVEEIFAVDVLPQRNAHIQGPATERADDAVDVWLVPLPAAEVRPEPAGSLYSRAAEPHPAPATKSAPPTWQQLQARSRELQTAGQLAQAADQLKQAILTAPQPAAMLVDLGNLQQQLGNQDAALQSYTAAVATDPQCIAARQNRLYLLFNQGEYERAAEGYAELLKLDPSPLNQLLAALALPVIYDSAEAVATCRQRLVGALETMVAAGATVDAARNQVPTTFFVPYAGLNDRPVMQDYGRILRGADYSRGRKAGHSGSDGRIRLGVLSAHFRDHTIGRLNIGRLEQLDRRRFELHLLDSGRASDALHQRFQQAAEHFHPLPRHVAAAGEQIAALDLDVLLFTDVGMDAFSSTLAYSRMAPVQCVTWGHPETTGSPHMDYFVSSELLETAAADGHYTEQLVRLPNLGTYYERPLRSGPERTRESFGLPADRRLYLCPQTLFKFHPDFDAALRGILAADPDAELVLIAGRVPVWTERLQARWRRVLPDADRRIRFLPAMSRDDFLGLLPLGDALLDPFPFGGGNSSYEALSAGVPAVTLPTPFLRGRITQALYRKLGDTSLCVASHDDYVRAALQLAHESAGRTSRREQLREAAGVLFEDAQEVRELEEFIEQVVSH